MQVRFHNHKELAVSFGIPYEKNDSPSSNNIGYFDTKKFPDSISLFPELKGWPVLEDLIRAMIPDDCIFRSLRCDGTVSKVNLEGYRYKFSSYVTIAFEILEWGTFDKIKSLRDTFLEFADPRVEGMRKDNIVEFDPVLCRFNDHKIDACVVDLWNHGFGRTRDKAENRWLDGMRVIKEFINDQSRLYKNELLDDRKKIGDILSAQPQSDQN